MASHLLLILKKNYKLKRRRFGFILEIVAPLFFFIIAAIVRSSIEDEPQPQSDYPSVQLNSAVEFANALPILEGILRGNRRGASFSSPNATIQNDAIDALANWFIGYAPNEIGSNAVMAGVREKILDDLRPTYGMVVDLLPIIRAYEDHGSMYQDAEALDTDLLASVRFTNLNGDGTLSSSNVAYTISMCQQCTPNTDETFPQVYGASRGPSFEALSYARNGFATFQSLIDVSIMQVLTGGTAFEVTLNQQRFPYPEWVDNRYTRGLGFFLPFFIVLAWIYTASMTVKDLVNEKERRLREAMRMMGLPSFVGWLGWGITAFSLLFFSIIFMTIITVYGNVVENTEGSVIFVFFLLCALATISYCFLMSTFFTRANIAAASSGVAFFILYIPYTFIAPASRYDTLNRSTKMGLCLISPTCIGLGGKTISQWEERSIGVNWSNINAPSSLFDGFSMADVFGMLVIDIILYFLLAWYIDNVFPGRYGVPRSWYFFVQKSYWTGKYEVPSATETVSNKHSEEIAPNCEPAPAGLSSGVDIRNLYKKFDNKVAVDGLSLTMYENQITSLLGHNGAGKTTTMSILTGLYPPTSGDAIVGGHSILKDMDGVRKSLGLCPQFDVLFDTLTVQEHLEFFCQLKGLGKEETAKEVDSMLLDLNLEDKRNAQARTLSGGMKRKLSVAIALVGGSKVVMLDEPTAGMDPYARRATWDLILKHKEGRTIILTTHFMDEADLLGDRIAIIANGRLQCVGSALFLKGRYGVGYHLTLAKSSKGCNASAVISLVHSMVPDASVEGDVGTELSMILPRESSSSFSQLFNALDEQKENLGITAYGIAITTMEEVFLSVGEAAAHREESVDGLSSPNGNATDTFSEARSENGAHVVDMNGNTASSAQTSPEDPQMPLEDAQQKSSSSSLSHTASVSTQVPNQANPSSTVIIPSASKMNVSSSSNKTSKVNYLAANADTTYEGARVTGLSLKWQHFKAMFTKRVLYSKRDRKAIISQFLVPVAFVILGLSVAKSLPPLGARGPLTFSPATYLPATAYYIENTPTLETSGIITELDAVLAANSVALEETADLRDSILNSYNELRTAFSSFGAYNFTGDSPVAGAVEATVLWNSEPLHALPIYLNALDSAILASLIPGASISTTNLPLPPTPREQDLQNRQQGAEFTVAVNIIFAMSFLAGSFVSVLVHERISNAKHLQFLAGVNNLSYWAGGFVWDVINYTFPIILIWIVFAIFNLPQYSGDNFAALALLFIFFGWATIPLVYILSFLFKSTTTAYVTIILLNVFLGLGSVITTWILEVLETAESANDALKWVFLVLPIFALGRGTMDIAYNDILVSFNIQSRSPLAWEVVGKNIFFMFIMGIVFFLILMGIEYRLFSFDNYRAKQQRKRILKSRQQSDAPDVPDAAAIQMPVLGSVMLDEDTDVAEERQRVYAQENAIKNSAGNQSPAKPFDIIRVIDLSKVFPAREGQPPKVAVDNITFGVPQSECFGLLGVNGAGKTTTFKMMTGDHPITDGDAYMNGYSVLSNILDVRKHIGYCPQFDGLLESLTGREVLTLYARLRGLPEDVIGRVVDGWIRKLELDKHADKPCGQYSGGNKRKLSTAVALIGDPPIIFLDEPTTGMDPKARRFLWNTISNIMHAGRAIVLTSHSMEECEALCTKLAIMVSGKFKCIGSPQHLKSRFGQGYELMIKIAATSDTNPLKERLMNKFSHAVLKEEHNGMVRYEIPYSDSAKLADVFSEMEEIKKVIDIEDYSLCQTSLERVFIDFAKHDDPSKLEV